MASENPWWQRFGNVAEISAAVIALLGFTALLLQLNELKSSNRASAARQVYLAYEDLNFRNPQFSAPDIDKLKASDPRELAQYKSFVSYLLYACAEVMSTFGSEPEWRLTCEYEIKSHLRFLCETQTSDPAYLRTFGKITIDFVTSEMKRHGVTPPQCQMKTA